MADSPRTGDGGIQRSLAPFVKLFKMGRSHLPGLSRLHCRTISLLLILSKSIRFLVAILTNQAGLSIDPSSKKIETDKKRLADWKAKINAILNSLDLPISLYAATSHDIFRKPRTGLWQQLLEDHSLNGTDDVNLSKSFFVGDAGGRTKSSQSNHKNDFSCSDRFVKCCALHHFS